MTTRLIAPGAPGATVRRLLGDIDAEAAPVVEVRAGGSNLSEDGLRFRHHLEAQTDAMQQSIIDAVGWHLDSHIKLLDAWPNALIAAGDAPPDPAKRAAG